MDFPAGVTIDPAGRRIYWTNRNDTISTARLDGSDAHDLAISGATVDAPYGIAVDSSGERIYWVNDGSDTISTAALDGSDAHDIAVTGTTIARPTGIAIDSARQRMYWANSGRDAISVANLDGSDARDVPTGNATVRSPLAVAFDPEQRTVYWANDGGSVHVASARVDGSTGGGDVVVGLDDAASPRFVTLLFAPRSLSRPAVSGGSTAGEVLTCSEGGWAPDAAASFVYSAPQLFRYRWSRDGIDVAGAAQDTLRTTVDGDYVCHVHAENAAGTTEAASAPHRVGDTGGDSSGRDGSSGDDTGDDTGGDDGSGDDGTGGDRPAFGADANVTLAVARRAHGRRVMARIANGNAFAVQVTIVVRTAKRIRGIRNPRGRSPTAFSLGARQRRTVALTLSRSMRRALADRRTLRLVATAVVTDPAGTRRTVRRVVTLKLARR